MTLAFSPYADDLPRSVAKARAAGHEILLQVPLEPYGYPDVDPGPPLLTVIVYVAPVCPCEKFPVCIFARVRSATCVMVVASVAVSLAVFNSPPPDTVTELLKLAAALLATFTVSVIAG